jgi:nitrate reductase molybdenum cofactor assembly chaperone NarJ/NarW
MSGERDSAVVLQAASVCLQYPNHQVRSNFPLVREALDSIDASARTPLLRFLDLVAGKTETDLARHYVSIFDERRRCCLYLTWWSDGDTRRRGVALAALKARFREAGVALTGTELPDFLPVVLEFAATTDLTGGLAMLEEHRPGLELLRLALRDAGTPYAEPVAAVCALLPGPSPETVAAAKEMARRGPPREQVGLELTPFSIAPGTITQGDHR